MHAPFSFILLPFNKNPFSAVASIVRIPKGMDIISLNVSSEERVISALYNTGFSTDHNSGLLTVKEVDKGVVSETS